MLERDEQFDAMQRISGAREAFLSDIAKDLRQKNKDLHAENARLRNESVWVRQKVGLPDDTPFIEGGGVTLAGTLHVVESHARGYKRYIESHKCDDKQGEIARQSVEIERLREDLATVFAKLRILSYGYIVDICDELRERNPWLEEK